MSFTDQMTGLRASLNDTKKRTNQAVKDVKREAQALVQEYAQTQKANAKQLREDLRYSTQNLVREVKGIRGDNIRSQQELKRDFVSAQNVFWGKQRPEEKEEKPA